MTFFAIGMRKLTYVFALKSWSKLLQSTLKIVPYFYFIIFKRFYSIKAKTSVFDGFPRYLLFLLDIYIKVLYFIL